MGLGGVLVILSLLIVSCMQQQSAKIIASGLEGLTANNNVTVGCIGLVIDEKMTKKERQLMLAIRFELKQSLTSVMVVTSEEAAIEKPTLCNRQQTLMVGPYTYLPIRQIIEKYVDMPETWSFKEWLVLLHSPDENEELIPWLETNFPMDIEYDANVRVFIGDRILQIFRMKEKLPITTHLIGEYSNEKEKFIWNSQENRVQLNGMLFKIACFNMTISRISYNNLTGQYQLVDGVYEQVWHLLEHMLNFTSEITLTDKHGWFVHPSEKYGWSEIESMVIDKTVDAAVTGVRDSPSKRKDLFLTHPIYLRRYFIYVRDPEDAIFVIPWDIFSAPFSLHLWIAIVCTILTISIFLYISAKFFGIHIWPKEAKRYSFFNCFFSIFRAFCNQGQEDDPKAIFSRIVYITTYMTSMIVLASYSGVLISFLTIGRATLPFDSLDDIYLDGTYQIGAKVNSSVHIFFQNANKDEVAHQIYLNQIMNDPRNLKKEYNEDNDRICKFKYAFLAGLEVEINLDMIPCKILKLQRDFVNTRLVIAFHKHFRFSKLFNSAIQEMLDHGILSKISLESLTRFRLKDEGVLSPSVDISQVAPLLIELLIAILVSILILLLEHLFNKKSRWFAKKNKPKEIKLFLTPTTQLTRWPKMSLRFH